MTVFALVPSQVPGVRHPVPPSKSEVALADDDDSLAGDHVVYNPPPSDASVASSSSSTRRKKRNSLPRTGNLPDVHWRAISMSHLRSHPSFVPLPPPSMINTLPTKEHARYFRQDSWQWDYLHTGRCTTSQAAAALGFLEPKAAHFLGIPRSLQRGGFSAWHRLQQLSDDGQSLDELEHILCEGRSTFDNDDVVGSWKPGIHDVVGVWRPGAKESERLWIPASRLIVGPTRPQPFPFSAKYLPNLTYEELHQRKMYLEHEDKQSSPSPIKTRMRWGNAQEATSILTALNHFCGEDNETTIHEVGMCGAGFAIDDPLLQGVKIGASPDAIICHGNGTVEVLEVKNHCPFVWNRISPHFAGNATSRSSSKKKKKNGKKKNGKKQKGKGGDHHEDEDKHRDSSLPKHYLVRDFQLERKIPPVYVPQLMMEMLCMGDAVDLDSSKQSKCESAVMVRQTATRGAVLLRLKRDEQWIEDMKYYLGEFKAKYCDTGTICPDNFFWSDDKNSRYRRFLQRTKELSESVEQVAFIDHGRIQRMVLERGVGGEVPLFLDRVREEE